MLQSQNLIQFSSMLGLSTGSKMAKVWLWNVEIRFGKGEFYGTSVEKNYSFTYYYYHYHYYYAQECASQNLSSNFFVSLNYF